MRKATTALMAALIFVGSISWDAIPASAQPGRSYYNNGRWVDQRQWDRDRAYWERRHRPPRRDNNDNTGAAIVGGLIGLALGAAIVGSTQQADRARNADQAWHDHCRAKYRSYDPASGTYMGFDGYRHYCQ